MIFIRHPLSQLPLLFISSYGDFEDSRTEVGSSGLSGLSGWPDRGRSVWSILSVSFVWLTGPNTSPDRPERPSNQTDEPPLHSFSPPRMGGLGTEAFDIAPYARQLAHQVPWRRSSSPIRRPANSTTIMSHLDPSHHGETGAAHPSSAEAMEHAGPSPHPLPVRASPHHATTFHSIPTPQFSSLPVRHFLFPMSAFRLLKHLANGRVDRG